MTEITDKPVSGKVAALTPAIEQFILQWGDMGGQWGVNRSVSQIHALLYLSERPLTAEEIADTLGLARSNVSNSIRELLAWDLNRRVPVKGDRREHFEAETDLWEIAMRIAAVRKERELDPAVAALRACGAEPERDPNWNPRAGKCCPSSTRSIAGTRRCSPCRNQSSLRSSVSVPGSSPSCRSTSTDSGA